MGFPTERGLPVAAIDSADKPDGYEPHIGDSRQYWRDIILGVNDGLVSMLLLVAGVVGGGLSAEQVLLTGVAGAIAGAISMAAGEYLATKSQDDVLAAELSLERVHIANFREMEVEQLRGMFREMGVAPEAIPSVVEAFSADDHVLLNAMKALEFGVVDSERRSPYTAMYASGLLFLLGSASSVLPFVFTEDASTGLLWASLLTAAGLFAVGVVKAVVSRSSFVRSGLENLLIAGAGGVTAWWVGRLVGTTLS
ncbi:MAG: VIT1/CCC1 transporter family protein [Acidimicrobiia bacterium]|nr:MAG: VIT1/CCC1 transporter family protein [Acidimicrobiia bacterium]